MRFWPKILLPATLPALAACATLTADVTGITPATPLHGLFDAHERCSLSRSFEAFATASAIDPRSIEVLNWNVQKGKRERWADELEAYGGSADIVLLQEAPLVNPGWSRAVVEGFHAFAPGHKTRRTPTGVMTVSHAVPLVQCNLSSREPWLRSPKATIVTEYAVAGRASTLLIVNAHAINFTLSTKAFEAQLTSIARVLQRHGGAVILAGDFNTWRPRRLDHLNELAEAFGLVAVSFDDDRRKRVFGMPLDHIFVRGLDVAATASFDTKASDHNPIHVRLSM